MTTGTWAEDRRAGGPHHRHQPHRFHHPDPCGPGSPARSFVESVAQEVAPFGIGMTIVEPGGARTEFRYGSARVADLTEVYDATPAHAFKAMLDPANGLAPGDPQRMARRGAPAGTGRANSLPTSG